MSKNGSSLYDFAALGLMAPLYSSRQQAGFDATKDALNTKRPRFREGFPERDGHALYLGPLGYGGLSYQPATDSSLNRYVSVKRAAQLGNVYRYNPKASMHRGLA